MGLAADRFWPRADVTRYGQHRCGQVAVKIEQALAISKACVAVIGRRWADASNLSHLQSPNDMVRHELETALASGDEELLTIISLLVEDVQLVQIPTAEPPQKLRP